MCELLLCPDEQVKYPETFRFDRRRLWLLRSQVQNMIDVYICWSILEELVESVCPKRSNSPIMYSYFVTRISAIIEEDGGSAKTESSSLGTHLPNDSAVAMEMARMICVVMGLTDDIPDEILELVEDTMKKSFADSSVQMQVVRDGVRQKLLQGTCELAQKYIKMSPLDICESQRRQVYRSPTSDFNYIAMKLAHIGVLHWRVWAPLVYLPDAAPSSIP